MADQIRVNIKHRVNNAAIKREQRNGREVIVVPSAVAKFDTVLNNIFYPRAELEASYQQLEGLPAPLGHPVVNNQFVSARTPEAINGFWAGAWNTNPRIEGDRVFADKVIDVEFAQNSENGRKLLAAIDEGKPISTSTGLLMQREPAPEGADYKWVGNSFAFDHDAWLLNEAPAIGTDAGVGVFVNSAGEQVEVVNSELEMDDDYVTAMVFEIVDNYERKEKQKRNAGLVERIKNAVRAVLSGDKTEEAAGLHTNSQTSTEEPQMTTEELQAMLDKQAETLQANQAQAIASAVSDAVKPLQDKLDAINAEAEAAAEAEKTTLVETVVEAKLATEDEAKALDVNALRIMARNCKQPKGADHPLNGGRLDATNSADDSKYDTLPE